jgi:hypothetical protein
MADRGADRRRNDDAAERFRRMDARDQPLDGEHEERPTSWQRLRRQAGWLMVAMAGLGLFGFGAGWVFAQLSSPTASRLVLTDRVVTEPDATEVEAPVPGEGVAPSSGESDAEPRCGVSREPVAADVQIATLNAGGVIVQYRPEDVLSEEVAELESIVAEVDSHVLVAPNEDLRSRVVATAWQHRFELDDVERAPLLAFVEGYRRPEAGACPE